jgi:hypothetical protein
MSRHAAMEQEVGDVRKKFLVIACRLKSQARAHGTGIGVCPRGARQGSKPTSFFPLEL